MTDKNALIILFLLIALLSCSSEETRPVQEKTYSASTEKAFADIEKGDVKQSIPPAHDIREKKSVQIPQQQKKGETSAPRPQEQTTLTTDDSLTGRAQERLQEINQNLAFYCMKHRNSFSSEGKCLQFTKHILRSCEKKHKLINTVMVNCIKDQLKKRR